MHGAARRGLWADPHSGALVALGARPSACSNSVSSLGSVISGIPGHYIEDVTISNVDIQISISYPKARSARTRDPEQRPRSRAGTVLAPHHQRRSRVTRCRLTASIRHSPVRIETEFALGQRPYLWRVRGPVALVVPDAS